VDGLTFGFGIIFIKFKMVTIAFLIGGVGMKKVHVRDGV
jgi:hypothetical protein